MPNLRRVLSALGLLACTVFVNVSSMGCADCAEYGEYCVDLDCCDDLVCKFDQTAGYRCR